MAMLSFRQLALLSLGRDGLKTQCKKPGQNNLPTQKTSKLNNAEILWSIKKSKLQMDQQKWPIQKSKTQNQSTNYT
jgi:hypothetical protein